MIDQIQQQKFQEFILRHKEGNVQDLALAFHGKVDFDLNLALQQIKGRQKAKYKLPLWAKTDSVVFPPGLNLQQSSSEKTAQYKSAILNGQSSVDLTGGFGIDSYFISKSVDNHTYVEPNESLATIAKHNFNALEATNIEVKQTTCEEFLDGLAGQDSWDWIYIDPSRQNEGKQVFFLEDYGPNVVDLQDAFFERADNILIKTSPILDIKDGLRKLKWVKAVHVIAVDNDVKEVLFRMERNVEVEPDIICFNQGKNGAHLFNFKYSHEQHPARLGSIKTYLYEPNASILKAGAFQSIANQYGLTKMHSNTHLYTSENHVPHFPGRTFKINRQVGYDPKSIKKEISEGKANIAVRNFPYSVEQIRKKTRLKDGGEVYLFGVTNIDNKPVVLICEKG